MTWRSHRDAVLSRLALHHNERRRERTTPSKGTHHMGIIAWIVVGAIAGFIATLIMGNREGILMTIILGIAGAVVGGFLAGALLNLEEPTGINVETIVVSVIGAIGVILVGNLVLGTGRRRGTA